MAASKKKIVETFTQVTGVGESYAEQMYDDLGLRSLDDLVTAAEEGKIQSLKGIGPSKEKSILKSAKELLSTSPSTESPAKKKAPEKQPKTKTKAKAKKAADKKSKQAKKPAPEASAKKEAPKKAAEADKKEAPKKETPKRAPRSTASDFEDRARKSNSSPGKRPTIPGLLFKIGKKLVSRLLS